MRVKIGSTSLGMDRPMKLHTSPATVAMISGLRTTSPMKPRFDPRDMGQTAAMLNSGTQMPITTAIMSCPCAPMMRSDSASMM